MNNLDLNNEGIRQNAVYNGRGRGTLTRRGTCGVTAGRGRGIESTRNRAAGRSGNFLSLEDRNVENRNTSYCSDFAPNYLTVKINDCKNFLNLRDFFYGQKNKCYFDEFHALTFWNALVFLLRGVSSEDIDNDFLFEMEINVCSFISDFDLKCLSRLASSTVLLLEYAKKKSLFLIQNIALNVLSKLFSQFDSKKLKEDLCPRTLANLADNGIKLLEYDNSHHDVVLDAMYQVLLRVKFWDDFKSFSLIDLLVLIDVGMKILLAKPLRELEQLEKMAMGEFTASTKNQSVLLEEVALHVLERAVQQIATVTSLVSLNSKYLFNLASNLMKFLEYEYSPKAVKNTVKEKALKVVSLVLDEINNTVEKKGGLNQFKPRHLCNFVDLGRKMLACKERKKIRLKVLRMLNFVLQEVNIRTSLKSFDPQTLSNLANGAVHLWEYERAGKKNLHKDVILEVIFKIFYTVGDSINSKDYNSQSLSVLISAGVKLLKYKGMDNRINNVLTLNMLKEVFKVLNDIDRLNHFNPQEFSNLMQNGMKVLEYESDNKKYIDNLVLKVIDCALRTSNIANGLSGFNPYDLSSLANSWMRLLEYGKLKRVACAEEVLSLLMQVFRTINFRESLKDFNPQDLSNVANAGVRVLKGGWGKNIDYHGMILVLDMMIRVFEALNNKDNFRNFSLQSLLNLESAGIILLRYELRIDMVSNQMHRLYSEVASRSPYALPSCAKASGDRQEYVEASAQVYNSMTLSNRRQNGQNLTLIEVGEVCNIAWIFSAVGKMELIEQWMMPVFGAFNEEEIALIESEGAFQLYQVFLSKALRKNKWNGFASGEFLFEEVYLSQKICHRIIGMVMEKWNSHQATEIEESVKKEMNLILEERGLDKGGYVWPHVHYSFVDEKKRRMFIRVNHAVDFNENGGYTLSGKFEEEVLTKMDYKVVNIDFVDWREAGDKRMFLEGKLYENRLALPSRNQRRGYSKNLKNMHQ